MHVANFNKFHKNGWISYKIQGSAGAVMIDRRQLRADFPYEAPPATLSEALEFLVEPNQDALLREQARAERAQARAARQQARVEKAQAREAAKAARAAALLERTNARLARLQAKAEAAMARAEAALAKAQEESTLTGQ